MLTSRIHVPPPAELEAEDIFQSSLATLFTDDVQNSHGGSSDRLIYTSPRFGDITVRIPQHPDRDAERHLFAHYLWNAAVLAADMIETASHPDDTQDEEKSSDDHSFGNVKGKAVLELGAGTALPSVIAMLCKSSEICATDHPESPALRSGMTEANLQFGANIVKSNRLAPLSSVQTHEWGSLTDPISQKNAGKYQRIIATDCLWMPSQHSKLAGSIAHFLSRDDPDACALVIAGFHTGRQVVADFFAQFQSSEGAGVAMVDLKIARISESDMKGNVRPWDVSRKESKGEANKWCVVAVLVRR